MLKKEISYKVLHFQTLLVLFLSLFLGYFILFFIPSLEICYSAQYLLCIQYKSCSVRNYKDAPFLTEEVRRKEADIMGNLTPRRCKGLNQVLHLKTDSVHIPNHNEGTGCQSGS